MENLDKVIIIRIGEIYLKGKNRGFFENLLIENIKKKLKGVDCKLFFGRNRYIVSDFPALMCGEIIEKLKTVFGIFSLSEGYQTRAELSSIFETVCTTVPNIGSFRVNCNRADKSFPLNSVELAREIGGRLLDFNSNLTVDLHNPDFTVNIDIRENGLAYVFSNRQAGAGGMPVGSSGKGLLLLSGGIDSPVAGYMMAKRGVALEALHFHSYPYTGEKAREKVEKLAEIMRQYCGNIKLLFISVTRLQEEINQNCDNNYLITILRRFMMRAAEKVALKRGCSCIINGESLGQVASQTVQSITATNSVVESLPIFRPLIGFDKHEIMEIAQKIDTFETSILPYEDCCTVFLPKKPIIKPTLKACEIEEKKLALYDTLLEQAIENMEIIG